MSQPQSQEVSVQQLLDTLKHIIDQTVQEKQHMERELRELRKYKDVSMVKSLAAENDTLKTENALLTKRLRTQAQAFQKDMEQQSMYSTRTAPTFKSTPKVATKSQRAHPALTKAPEPVIEPEPEPVLEEPEEEPEQEPEQPEEEPKQAQQEQEEPEQEPEEPEQEEELVYIDHLKSGKYFWNAVTGNLYDAASPDEAGVLVGRIKTIKIRDQYYYEDTTDYNVYRYVVENGDIGNHCGSIVNRKFIKA